MPLIDLDSIQLYQGSTKADLAGKISSMASIGIFVVCEVRNAPMVFGCSGGWGQRLDDYKLAPGPRNGPDPIGGHGGGGGEEDESLPSVEELLLGIRGAQESRRTGLRLGGDKGANTNSSSSSVHPRSDSLTSEEQGERHYSLSTPPTSVAYSEDGYDP